MGKHAYLIMAHNHFETLGKILSVLDDERNDLFVHVDKKAGDFDRVILEQNVKKSGLIFVERIDVVWGGFSQIECEMNLIKAVLRNGEYDYLHLISGADLPLKNQNDIHDFFDKNKGTEFVEYDKSQIEEKYMDRVRHAYRFQNVYGRNRKNPLMIALFLFDKVSDRLQTLFKVNRVKNENVIWQKGPNWFSITGEFARYLVSHEDFINRVFKYSVSGDEMFLQTVLVNSEYGKNVYKSGVDAADSPALRKIDWNRGAPYTFRFQDYDELISDDNAMFARKFNPDTDNRIIEAILEYVRM